MPASDSGCPALKAASKDAMGCKAGKEVQVRKDRQVKSVPLRPFEGKKCITFSHIGVLTLSLSSLLYI